MNAIPYYDILVATSVTSITPVYVDKYDQLMIRVPKVVGFASSSPVAITLKGAPSANQTVTNVHYYDYVNKTPATSVITISTGGVYEMPYPGANQYVSIQFDTAVSNTTNIQLITPKTTY